MREIFSFALMLVLCCGIADAQARVLDATYPSATSTPGFANAVEESSGPVVYDINGDGLDEVIVTGRRDVWVFNVDHPDFQTSAYHWLAPDGYGFCSPVTVCHLSGDGYAWVVVGASKLNYSGGTTCPYPMENPAIDWHAVGECYHWQSILMAWRITGPLPSDTVQHSATVDNMRLTSAVAADVDGDGLDELCFVGTRSFGLDFDSPPDHTNEHSSIGIQFWEADGQEALTERFVTEDQVEERVVANVQNGYVFVVAQTMAAAGDVDGEDGKPEFVTQAYGRVRAFTFPPSGLGTVRWTTDLTVNNLWDYPPEGISVANERDEHNVVHYFPWDYAWDQKRSPGPVLADLTGQGQLDVFVKTDASIYRLGGQDGTSLVSPPYQGSLHGDYSNSSEFAVGDDRNTGVLHLLDVTCGGEQDHCGIRVRRWTPNLLLWNANYFHNFSDGDFGQYDNYAIGLLESPVGDGVAVYIPAEENLISEKCAGPEESWETITVDAVGSSGPVKSNVTAADLNNNGLMEYVFTERQNSTLSHVYAIETTLPYNPEQNEWSGYRNGPGHRGLYSQPVTGTQLVTDAVWEGRITVHGTYTVPAGYSLTIKPGTVVEFRPDAVLQIDGALTAIGQGKDSIYFKPDGSGSTYGILLTQGLFKLARCVIHDGTSLAVQFGEVSAAGNRVDSCHIYNMQYGLDVSNASRSTLSCQGNLIEDCSLYGIRGTTSAGTFADNLIRHGTRAGIY